jgi:hypothetical protein
MLSHLAGESLCLDGVAQGLSIQCGRVRKRFQHCPP